MSAPRLFLRLLFPVIGLLCIGATVSAQTPASAPPKPATLRFLFLDETAGAYALKLGESYRQVSASPYVISPPYIPATLERIELFKSSSVPDPKTGAPVRVRVAAFTPPASTTSALVIITPRTAPVGSIEPPVYDVEFIDSSPSTFPGGSLRILNRGQAAMAARLASGQVTAEPGETRIITPMADERGRLRILVAVQGSGQWSLIDDNVAIVKPDTRLTGLLVYSPSGMKFRLGPYVLAERGDPPPSHVWLTYTDTP